MSITNDEVKYVASLARLSLNEEEVAEFTGQLDSILGYIDQLNELDVKDVSPTSQLTPSENVLREDVVDNTFDKEHSLKNAPLREEDFFKVPKVID